MSKLAYMEHFKSVHPGVKHQKATSLIPCPRCDVLFKYEYELGSHLVRVHGEEKKHACGECGEKFANKQALYHHKYRNHAGTACVCEDCGATFDGKFKLRVHRDKAHPPVPNACPECRVTYASRGSLRRHNALVHGIGHHSVLGGSCEDCGKKFATKDGLLVHAYRSHGKTLPGLKMFPCPICKRVFHKKSHVQEHVKTHVN